MSVYINAIFKNPRIDKFWFINFVKAADIV